MKMVLQQLEFDFEGCSKFRKKDTDDVQKSVSALFDILDAYSKLEKKVDKHK